MPDVIVLVRRDADSGGKLSTSTIIVIAVVAGCVVILVLALFAWRLIARSLRRSRKVPLPPVQDLAHHREQQLAAFADRNSARQATWVESSKFVQPHPHMYSAPLFSGSGSSASLIRQSPDFTVTRGRTRESSWAIDSADGSPYPPPLSTEDFLPPNPSFLPVGMNPHNSMSSVASSVSDGISDTNVALPATPSEYAHSVESSLSLVNTTSAHGSPVRARPARASPSRRTMSVISSAGTMHSMQRSRSSRTLRGPAHSIHSNVQIVLPTPLAPDLHPRAENSRGFEREISFYGGGGDKRSVADQWVNAGTRPASVVRPEREASRSSQPSSAPRPRPRSSLSKVASTSSLSDSGSMRARARRASSQPPIPPTPSAPAVSASSRARTPSPGPSSSRPTSSTVMQPDSPLPPVPRIPSIYGQGSFGDMNGNMNSYAQEEPMRGRARVLAPGPAPTLSPPSYVASPLKREPSGKLRKQRVSTQDAGRR